MDRFIIIKGTVTDLERGRKEMTLENTVEVLNNMDKVRSKAIQMAHGNLSLHKTAHEVISTMSSI